MKRGIFSFLWIFASFFSASHLVCPPPEPIPECFTQIEFDQAIKESRAEFENMERELMDNFDRPGFLLTEHDAAFSHFETHDIGDEDHENNRIAFYVNDALVRVKNLKNLTKSQFQWCLKNHKTSTKDFCKPKVVSCNPSTTSYYRSDGQCNNQVSPLKGARNMPMIRLFNDGFEDGIQTVEPEVNTPRTDSVDANAFKGIVTENSPEINSDMSTTITQILTHEFMETKKVQLFPNKRGGGFCCCNPNNDTFIDHLIKRNKFCMPISVKKDDPCFKDQDSCLNYIKAMKSLNNCNLDSPPMLTNFHTPYIDAELIYSEGSLRHLNENFGRFDVDNFGKMEEILVGYDVRSKQLPGLFLYLNFFCKFHNIIFDELKRFKSSWTIQALSHEARKITTAAYQKCFLDFLINILPEEHGNVLRNLGKCYDPLIDPQVSLEFNLGLRLFHYFIRESVSTYDERLFLVTGGIRGRRPSDVPIFNVIDDLSMYKNNLCGITHGPLDMAWNLGGIGPNIHCKFFSPKSNRGIGTDLRSLDFQTGQENGQPKYVEVLRKLHGVKKCDEEFTKNDFVIHDAGMRDFLEKRFNGSLAKVSFSLGADLEDKRGFILSPSNNFIIVDQMKRSICGDRFWFNNADFFREDHKERVRFLDFFTIVCLVNNCNGTRIQADPFLSPGNSNRKKICPSKSQILSDMDLSTW